VPSPSNTEPHYVPSLSLINRVTLIQNPVSSSKDPGYYAWLNHNSALTFFFKMPNALYCHIVAVILSDLRLKMTTRSDITITTTHTGYLNKFLRCFTQKMNVQGSFETSVTIHHPTRHNISQDLNLQLLMTSLSWRHRIKRSCYPNWQLSHTSPYHTRSKTNSVTRRSWQTYSDFILFVTCIVNWLANPFSTNKCTLLLSRISLLISSYMFRLDCDFRGDHN
jgi:hypothetical protein